MPSYLTIPDTAAFRNSMISRNLRPYTLRPSIRLFQDFIPRDLPVIDSDDTLIADDPFADLAYPLNQYGPQGGYNKNINYNNLLPRPSNEGEYDLSDAERLQEGVQTAPIWISKNRFQPDLFYFYQDLPIIILPQVNAPYPDNFVPSTYSPYSILINPDPNGDNGRLSQDSYIARLGAETLRKEFEERIGREVEQLTIKRANFLNLNDPINVINIIKGTVPLIEPNYSITVPSGPINAAVNFGARLTGTYIPVSPIPGDYFDANAYLRVPGQTSQLAGAAGVPIGQGFLNAFLRPVTDINSSQRFLNNTGQGQKSVLFNNLDYNKFKPPYSKTAVGSLVQTVLGNQGVNEKNGEFYVGSPTNDPARASNPSGDLPIDEFGREIETSVYGSQLGKLYEGEDKDLKFGLNGVSYGDGGGIAGGFTWVSPKYTPNAGKHATPGGGIGSDDPDFPTLAWGATESTQYDFTRGSILDDTQRLVNSQPNGAKRLRHVGNAIDQVSKVFNDGYKEMTKGSRVLRYENQNGTEVGIEYCRVWTKDTPYLQYNDLVKTEGITTENRRFTYSILDKTYNLNIAPEKGGDSIENFPLNNCDTANSRVKKYMFSIENLAWRTGNRPGFRYIDLPFCERGPNGGRIMWFPPYDIKVSESSSANWNTTDFLGRPEPVYTYKNTSRTGTLSWKVIVDHPSILNTIVQKVLANENNREKVDNIVDSFFAGCKKYDIYELVKIYGNICPDEIFQIQEIINKPYPLPDEDFDVINGAIIPGNIDLGFEVAGTDGGNNTVEIQPPLEGSTEEQQPFEEFVDYTFYFDNDVPGPQETSSTTTTINWRDVMDTYISPTKQGVYYQTAQQSQKEPVSEFFKVIEENNTQIENFLRRLYQILSENPNAVVTVDIISSASAPNTKEYNVSLSKRRFSSVVNYISNVTLSSDDGQISFGQFINASPQRLILNNVAASGEETTVYPKRLNGESSGAINCTTDLNFPDSTYSVNAMACRRATFKRITVEGIPPVVTPPTPGNIDIIPPPPGTPPVIVPPVITPPKQDPDIVIKKYRDNITTFLTRKMLSECDYFQVIQGDNPMVYDSLKDKLKYFSPAFHSMTPEGLNARLTFLQQCLRPGDTIPTVQVNANGTTEFKYDNAVNTSFGAPPVLVLRFGDFFHTKIIPTNLQIGYDPFTLDTNPEGIGVQPMIANISLSFNFIGVEGLKGPVDTLQNALSFNYYANTEVYDDRAEKTDPSKLYDQEFLQKFIDQKPVVTTNTANQVNSQIENDGGNTIGKVISTTSTSGTTVGQIQYKDIMNDLIDQSQNYFNTVYNKIKEIGEQHNLGVVQLYTKERQFIEGSIPVTSTTVNLFGKPVKLQDNTDELINLLIDDINNDNWIFFSAMLDENITAKTKRKVKKNMIDYLNGLKGTFSNDLYTITQELVDAEMDLIKTINKVSVVTNDDSDYIDGFIKQKKEVIVYHISGTSQVSAASSGVTDTKEELKNDFATIGDYLHNFYELIGSDFTTTINGQSISEKLLSGNYNTTTCTFSPLGSYLNTDVENRAYQILAHILLDNIKREQFTNAIITQDVIDSQDLSKDFSISNYFSNYFDDDFYNVCKNEQTLFISWLEAFKANPTNNTTYFGSFTPYTRDKERVFDFSTKPVGTTEEKQLFLDLYSTKNTNKSKTTWMGKVQLN